jgi:hypothetical protein
MCRGRFWGIEFGHFVSWSKIIMPKIVIMAKTVNDPPKFISHIKRVTGLRISDIQLRLHKHLPLVEWTLFMNDHDEIAQRLRDLLTLEDRSEGVFGIFELMPEEDFSQCSRDTCEISAPILRNILDSYDERRLRRESKF